MTRRLKEHRADGRRAPTPFEGRVYAVVRRIPRGQTRSYGWVAWRLGNPGLARAVGGALHRNPDTRRTPCHRVINTDGTLGGYARGLARKRQRLQAEGWPPARTAYCESHITQYARRSTHHE